MLGTARVSTDYLTGVRGLAALLVLFAHATHHYFNATGPYTAPLAMLAMTLFFVLSGFVLTLGYSDVFTRGDKKSNLFNFFLARFARLVPLYFVFLFVINHFSKYFYNVLPQALSYTFMTQSWFNNQNLVFDYTWSISTEFFFYLFLPPLLLLFTRFSSLPQMTRAFAVIVSLGFMGSYLFYTYGPFIVQVPLFFSGSETNDIEWMRSYNPYLRLFDFMLGCISAKIYLHLRTYPASAETALKHIPAACAAIIAAALLYKALLPDDSNFFVFTIHNVALSPLIGLALIGMGLCRHLSLTRFFETRFMLFTGELSYSLYLLHFTAFSYVFKTPFFHQSGMAVQLCYYLGGMMLAYVFAFASYHIIENPSRRWIRKHFSKRAEAYAV